MINSGHDAREAVKRALCITKPQTVPIIKTEQTDTGWKITVGKPFAGSFHVKRGEKFVLP